jgi:hypothetical protein
MLGKDDAGWMLFSLVVDTQFSILPLYFAFSFFLDLLQLVRAQHGALSLGGLQTQNEINQTPSTLVNARYSDHGSSLRPPNKMKYLRRV